MCASNRMSVFVCACTKLAVTTKNLRRQQGHVFSCFGADQLESRLDVLEEELQEQEHVLAASNEELGSYCL